MDHSKLDAVLAGASALTGRLDAVESRLDAGEARMDGPPPNAMKPEEMIRGLMKSGMTRAKALEWLKDNRGVAYSAPVKSRLGGKSETVIQGLMKGGLTRAEALEWLEENS